LNFDIYISSIRATERINIRQAYQEGYGFGYDLGHYDGYKEGCNNTEKEINAG
jgi:flagellar biosynthesis/type III secretory pathway protein FliH